jgi:ABC-type transport system involved in cytochrome c biogenesis permease component
MQVDLRVPAWRLLPIALLGRALINVQIAAGYALTLRLRLGGLLLYGRLHRPHFFALCK